MTNWAGFHPLRPGKIHVYCPFCHLKRSNMNRADYDPPSAEILQTPCEECCVRLGAKDPGVEYLNGRGGHVVVRP